MIQSYFYKSIDVLRYNKSVYLSFIIQWISMVKLEEEEQDSNSALCFNVQCIFVGSGTLYEAL